MALSRSYLVTLVLYISAVNELRLPQVTCQDEEGSQCIPKRAFLALLRLPEVSSNLAAYSRTARVMQDAKNRNDMAHLKALTEEGDEAEICIPGGVYLELFRDPAMRGHLSVIGRTQKLPDFPGRLLGESEEVDPGDLFAEAEKRSIATLAKNDDLPISIQDREENEDDEEKRSFVLSDMDDYAEKRNVGSLARDFALPNGRRNVASLARDYGLPSGKRNIGALARDRMLPYSGKRNVASLARDYALPYGKRYLGSLARTGGFPYRGDDKRSVASLARNSDWPVVAKRGVSAPAGIILRTLNRHGRSLSDANDKREPSDLQDLASHEQTGGKKLESESPLASRTTSRVEEGENSSAWQARNRSNRKAEAMGRRLRRQVDFSDEYPLPVMQNANILDYEEMMEALAERYPNAEKRFMGRIPQMGPRPTTPPTRRLGR